MKKMLLASLFLLLAHNVKAAGLWDQIEGAFVGNAKLATEFTTRGENAVQYLDNFVEIGHIYGDQHVAALDLGGQGIINSDTGKFEGGQFTTGFKFHLSPFIKNTIKLQPQYAFLSNVELDARGSYNWTEHHPQYGLVVAYPFK